MIRIWNLLLYRTTIIWQLKLSKELTDMSNLMEKVRWNVRKKVVWDEDCSLFVFVYMFMDKLIGYLYPFNSKSELENSMFSYLLKSNWNELMNKIKIKIGFFSYPHVVVKVIILRYASFYSFFKITYINPIITIM